MMNIIKIFRYAFISCFERDYRIVISEPISKRGYVTIEMFFTTTAAKYAISVARQKCIRKKQKTGKDWSILFIGEKVRGYQNIWTKINLQEYVL